VPLDIDDPGVFGENGIIPVDSFTDLIHGHRPPGNIDLEIEVATDGEPVHLQVTVQSIDEYRIQVVSSWKATSGGRSVGLTWEQDGIPVTSSNRADRYSVVYEDERRIGVPVAFRGLLPDLSAECSMCEKMSSESVDRILRVVRSIVQGFPRIRYLGPFRTVPSRRYRIPSRVPSSIGNAGENAVTVLAGDTLREQGTLVRILNEEISQAIPGWRIEVLEEGRTRSVLLVSRDNPHLRINLADTGTGVAQVLPILVQRVMDLVDPPAEPVLEIVEEPELHLHPAAHAGLADLYLDRAVRSRTRFLVETHSETFVLRLRRRIAEGRCSPQDVALYFVDHRNGAAVSRRIRIDEDGGLDHWPEGVFCEDYAETQALVRAQLKRQTGES